MFKALIAKIFVSYTLIIHWRLSMDSRTNVVEAESLFGLRATHDDETKAEGNSCGFAGVVSVASC
jgi:hypothetical protein